MVEARMPVKRSSEARPTHTAAAWAPSPVRSREPLIRVCTRSLASASPGFTSSEIPLRTGSRVPEGP
jgi:hypothetical protein